MKDIAWLDDKEQALINLGYVIGFFNADGGYSLSQNGNFSVVFVQKLKEPLVKIQTILEKWEIQSSLTKRISSSQLRENANQWSLRLDIDSAVRFVDLVDGNLSGQKARDHDIVKKVVELRKNWFGKYDNGNWIAGNILAIGKLVREWKQSRAEYKKM